jgi:hypothetical protein
MVLFWIYRIILRTEKYSMLIEKFSIARLNNTIPKAAKKKKKVANDCKYSHV